MVDSIEWTGTRLCLLLIGISTSLFGLPGFTSSRLDEIVLAASVAILHCVCVIYFLVKKKITPRVVYVYAIMAIVTAHTATLISIARNPTNGVMYSFALPFFASVTEIRKAHHMQTFFGLCLCGPYFAILPINPQYKGWWFPLCMLAVFALCEPLKSAKSKVVSNTLSVLLSSGSSLKQHHNPLGTSERMHVSHSEQSVHMSHISPATELSHSSLSIADVVDDIYGGSLGRQYSIIEDLKRMIWRKGAIMGHGGTGKVMFGLNSVTGEVMAVKTITLTSSEDTNEKLCQMQSEVSILKETYHEHIVPYFFSELYDSTLYIFMEYCAGGSLSKVMQQYGPLNEVLVIRFINHLLSALVFMHTKQLAHLDVKCANLLLMPNGVVKLADFGCAQLLKKAGMKGSTRGSAHWMAPEMANGDLSTKADIWSTGCTVLEMITGRPPFSDIPEDVSAEYIMTHEPDFTYVENALSTAGKEFVQRCLQRNPDNRPTALELTRDPWLQRASVNLCLKRVVRDEGPEEHGY